MDNCACARNLVRKFAIPDIFRSKCDPALSAMKAKRFGRVREANLAKTNFSPRTSRDRLSRTPGNTSRSRCNTPDRASGHPVGKRQSDHRHRKWRFRRDAPCSRFQKAVVVLISPLNFAAPNDSHNRRFKDESQHRKPGRWLHAPLRSTLALATGKLNSTIFHQLVKSLGKGLDAFMRMSQRVCFEYVVSRGKALRIAADYRANRTKENHSPCSLKNCSLRLKLSRITTQYRDFPAHPFCVGRQILWNCLRWAACCFCATHKTYEAGDGTH